MDEHTSNHDEEAEITRMEEEIPYLAAGAFRAGRERALAAGSTLVEAQGDALYEISPDGTRRFIKDLPPRQFMAVGTRFTLK